MGLNAFSLDRVLSMDSEFLDDSKEHQHDKSVGSIGFSFEGEMNLKKLENWLMALLKIKGSDLFRYKGILAVKGFKQKYVFQGVHMLFGGTFSAEWKDSEPRMNRFVFIGKNLDRDEMKGRFMECLLTDELRFSVGSAVKCIVTGGWTKGTVIALWDDGNPYRVLLDNGDEVWAPEDSDRFIRSAVPTSKTSSGKASKSYSESTRSV
jgi:hypothetical protein